jgi:hypothetical protein
MSEESPIAVIIGMFTILGILLCLIGCGFGIAGVCQKGRKKIFSILGIIFNGAILLGVVAFGLAYHREFLRVRLIGVRSFLLYEDRCHGL